MLCTSGFMDGVMVKSKDGTVRHCQSKEASILRSHHEETRELPVERDNARKMPGARRRGRPRTAWIDNIKTWREIMEKVRPRCGQLSDRGWLMNRTELAPQGGFCKPKYV